jgi:ribonuclease III
MAEPANPSNAPALPHSTSHEGGAGRLGGAPGAPLPPLEAALHYQFQQPDLLRAALIHRSYLHDVAEGAAESNERLEFLGDAVLGFVVARRLYLRHPDKPEGQLTNMRGALVRLSRLSAWGAEVDLGRYLYLSKGEEAQGGRERATIIGRAMEALLGALYLDGGLEAVETVLGRFLDETTESQVAAVLTADYKSQLQRAVQARSKSAPQYRLVDTSGPDHALEFTVEVWAEDRVLGRGLGRSKQQAEQAAAHAGLQALEDIPDGTPDGPLPPGVPPETV